MPEGRLVEQELLAAGPASRDVDGGEDPSFGESAVQVHLHVPSALELLVDHVVHPASGIDQTRRHDGQTSSVLHLARGPEELPRRVERDRIHPARKRASAGWHGEVVRPRKTSETVENDANVASRLHQSLGTLKHQLRHLAMSLHRLVERGAIHLAVDGALHVRDFLRTLSNERHHQVDVRRVRRDAVGDLLEQGRLPRLWRRNDQAPLSSPDRRNQVDEPRGQLGALVFQLDMLVWRNRRQILEVRTRTGRVGVHIVDRVHPNETKVPLAILRSANLPIYLVSSTQPEPPDLRLRNIDVVYPRRPPLWLEEAIALGSNRQYPARHQVAVLVAQVLKQPVEQRLPTRPRPVLEQAQLSGHVQEFLIALFLKLRDVHDVPPKDYARGAGKVKTAGISDIPRRRW